jgi:hypothetical protein
MHAKRTYVVSVQPDDGPIVLEDVRTRRRAGLSDLAQIPAQIDLWLEQDRDVPAAPADNDPAPR